MRFISRGTPGSRKMSLLPRSQKTPGAVPSGLLRGFEPAGKSTCLKFAGGGTRLRCAYQVTRSARHSAFSTNSTPKVSAHTSLVKSSNVGPSPPVQMITSLRRKASWKSSARSSRWSPTAVLRWSPSPNPAKRSAIHTELVSSRFVVSSSEPMAIHSMRTGTPSEMQG